MRVPRPPLAVWLPLLATVLAGLGLLAAPMPELARTLPTEDGFYALSVARHLGMGNGITIDGTMETSGFQPLWVALTAPLYALVDGDRVLGLRLTQLFGTVLWLAFAAAIGAAARDLARRHGIRDDAAWLVAVIVAIGSVSVFRAFHNGLETGLTLLVLACAVLVVDRTERWTPGRTAAVGALLGALVWARLDAVFFVMALGAVALWRGRSAPRSVLAPLAACAIAAVLIVPWLLWSVHVDGNVVPSSGRAQATHILPERNAHSAVRAIGAWILAPGFRPSMHVEDLHSTVISFLALGLLGVAVAAVARRAGGLRAGPGTSALALYLVILFGYYTFRHSAWWFQDRYLAPMLVLAVPWVAAALALVLADRRRLSAFAIVVAALNLPLYGALLAAPPGLPPDWAAWASNTGTHPNDNWEQAEWALERVRPECDIGGLETGTLLYFRDRVTNLDGKVNADALRARETGTMPQYADERGLDVLVDIATGIRRVTRDRRGPWRRVDSFGYRHYAYVREGREWCIRSAGEPAEDAARQVSQDREHPPQQARRVHRVRAVPQP